MRKVPILAAILIVIFLIPHSAVYSWWDVGHKTLATKAIDYLPGKWKTFFRHYEYFIQETCVWPDTVLARKAGESYNHYYDSEYSLEAHLKNPKYGRLPWRVAELMENLTYYIENEDWYNVIVTAGVLSHYLADSTQPYHSTVDYNPPVTSNVSAPGVKPKHALVEGTHAKHIDEVIPPDLNITPIYIEDPLKFMFNIINESYSFLDELNSIVLGQDITDPSDDRDWPELKPLLENRSIRAIWLISSMWYTAIVDADAVDKAPDPTKFMKLHVSVKGLEVPATKGGMYVTIKVVDDIGIPVDVDSISITFGDDKLTAKRLDIGQYSVDITFSQLLKYSGEAITFKIDVGKSGYDGASYAEELSIPVYEEEKPTQFTGDIMIYIAVLLVIIAVAVALVFLRKRR
jgi:hypothetical protein